MKSNLGKIFFFLAVFFNTFLFASTYEWSSFIDKKSAYVNEAIYLQYTCTFSDQGELYSVDFTPSGEYEKYKIVSLKESSSIINGHKINHYEFVLFPKKAGEIEIAFEALMKKTTKESIEDTVIGRDNVKNEQVEKKSIKQQVFHLSIKEANAKLIGDFILETKKREPYVKAHEPYHLTLSIAGKGNFDAFETLQFEIENVRVFAGNVEFKKKLTKSGVEGYWSQKFAFVGEQNFTIPKLEISYFNLQNEKIQTLLMDAIDVSVEKGYTKEALLDKEEEQKRYFEISYLYYLLTFIAGYLMALIKIKKAPKKETKEKSFYKKLENTKSLDALSVLLILENATKYDTIIKDIEAKKITSLKFAKAIIFTIKID